MVNPWWQRNRVTHFLCSNCNKVISGLFFPLLTITFTRQQRGLNPKILRQHINIEKRKQNKTKECKTRCVLINFNDAIKHRLDKTVTLSPRSLLSSNFGRKVSDDPCWVNRTHAIFLEMILYCDGGLLLSIWWNETVTENAIDDGVISMSNLVQRLGIWVC